MDASDPGSKKQLCQPVTLVPVRIATVQDVTAEYSLGKVLGRGQFGTTRVAELKGKGKEYACKSIAKRKLT